MHYIGEILPFSFSQELEQSYYKYIETVVLSRAVMALADGFKPVQRRIIYHMYNKNIFNFIKSAAVIGDILAKYHPHGNTSIYDATVRLTKGYINNIPLITGQGNFGSRDGDSAAHFRYTEVKLHPINKILLSDLDYDTVDYMRNYTGTDKEPEYLPVKLPLFLINGGLGIAVGITSSIPPHNPLEVIDGMMAMIEDPAVDIRAFIQGPDFPTGGSIINTSELQSIYEKGEGIVRVKGQMTADIMNNKISIHEIPYNVIKSHLVRDIYNLRETLPIKAVYDYSDMHGVHIEVIIEPDKDIYWVMNNIWLKTDMITSVSIRMYLIHQNRPQLLSLRTAVSHFISIRRNAVYRKYTDMINRLNRDIDRMKYDIYAMEFKDTLLKSLNIADKESTIHFLQEHINIKPDSFKHYPDKLKTFLNMYPLKPVEYIELLNLRIATLGKIHFEILGAQIEKALSKIDAYTNIINNEENINKELIKELKELRETLKNCTRKTTLTNEHIQQDTLIEKKSIVYFLTSNNGLLIYDSEDLKVQKRGGAGINIKVKEPIIGTLTAYNNIDTIFVSNKNKFYKWRPNNINNTRVYLNNILKMDTDEYITCMSPCSDLNKYALGDKKGNIKITHVLSKQNGIRILSDKFTIHTMVPLSHDTVNILLITKLGKALKVPVSVFREAGRFAGLVKGIRLYEGDELRTILPCLRSSHPMVEDYHIIVISEDGLVKRVDPSTIPPRASRGSYGVAISKKACHIIGALAYDSYVQSIVISVTTANYKIINAMCYLRVTGRLAKGVKLLALQEGDSVKTILRL